jgi:hypothetical protein
VRRQLASRLSCGQSLRDRPERTARRVLPVEDLHLIEVFELGVSEEPADLVVGARVRVEPLKTMMPVMSKYGGSFTNTGGP